MKEKRKDAKMAKTRRKLSYAARERIALLTRARWAKGKAAK